MEQWTGCSEAGSSGAGRFGSVAERMKKQAGCNEAEMKVGGNERAGCSGGEAEAEGTGPETEAGAQVECSGERSGCDEAVRGRDCMAGVEVLGLDVLGLDVLGLDVLGLWRSV